MATARTYYETLNVAPEAELVVIEAAYRALMKKYHPDQGGGAADGPSAAAINQAYRVLRDAERRAQYDHTEWIRQRDIGLAAYQPLPPPPRRSNFFGWGGWLVSAVLAGMIALMASKGGGPQVSEAEQARLAAMAAPDLRSQPVLPEKSVVTPEEAARIQAAAYAAKLPAGPPPAPAAPTAPAAAAADTIPAPPAAAAAPPAPHPQHRPVYAHRRPHAARSAARQKDFLERQGYIY